MLLAVESLVRLFESLILTRAAPAAKRVPYRAANDNAEASEEEQRWMVYR